MVFLISQYVIALLKHLPMKTSKELLILPKTQNSILVAGEVGKQVKALAALLEDVSLIPSTSIAVNNHLKLQFQSTRVFLALFWNPWSSSIHRVHTHIYRQNTYTHTIRIKYILIKYYYGCLPPNLTICVQCLGTIQWKIRTNSYKLSSELYTIVPLCFCPHSFLSCNSLQPALPLHQGDHQTNINVI